MKSLIITMLLLPLYLTVYGQTYALFDTTIQCSSQAVRFNTIFNHDNEFYVVTASEGYPYYNKMFYKFDTLGNVILQKTYSNNTVGTYDNLYNTYLWEDTVFYNLTFDNDTNYYLIAFDYNFDTLWKKHIPITDTNLLKSVSHTLNISRTADNGFLLSFNVLHNLINGMYPKLPLIIRTDGYGNIINYHYGSRSIIMNGFSGRKIAFTQDSCFLTTNSFNGSKLLKYNMNAQRIDSLLGVISADEQMEESFDIINTEDGKCIITTVHGNYVNDDLVFSLWISFVDYDNWQKIWTKKIDLGNRDIYPRALLTLNKIANNKYVVSGTYRNNDKKGFHLVFNEQGDILFVRHELHKNQGDSWLSDVVFLDSTHILGVGVAGNPWIFKKEIDLISSVGDVLINTNDFKLFPNPATEKIYLVPNDNLIDKEVSVEILNSLGKRIIYYSNVKLSNNYPINVNDIGSGVYYLVVKYDNSSTLRKFIVK